MRPRKHLIYGCLFAVACYFLFGSAGVGEALVIWVCSWLIIDLDHVVRYSVKTGSLSPKGFWEWSKKMEKRWRTVPIMEKGKYKSPVFIFHGVESLIVLFLLGLKWDFFLWCFVGFLFHLILDWINLYAREENVLAKVSVIYVLVNNRGKKGLKRVL